LLLGSRVYPLELLGVVAQQGVTEGGGLLGHDYLIMNYEC
jgi:hypothetical protein